MNGLYFFFNGINSEDMGICSVNLENGMKPEPFLSARELITETIIGNDTPYFYGIKRQPIKFTLTLSLLDDLWTFEKRNEIAKWLDNDQFNEFYFLDEPSKRYYVICDSVVDLVTNTNLQGYITVNFTNISPYSYSPVYHKAFNCSANNVTAIEIPNSGNSIIYPEVEIYKIGNGSVQIQNISHSTNFILSNLLDKETVYIDNKNHDVITDVPLTSRYNDFNNEYLKFGIGMNRLIVTGKCHLKFTYQYQFRG